MAPDFRISLQPLISGLFIVIILGIGGAITFQSYDNSRELILKHTHKLVDIAADRFTLSINRTYHPIGLTLEMFSHETFGPTRELEDRLRRVPMLVRVLEAERHVRALMVGNEKGEFFMVGRFQTDSHREALQAPAEAVYFVTDNQRMENGEVHSTHRFLDSQLELLELRPVGQTPFDPRKRPWFLSAKDESTQTIITDPYVYASEAVLGITMARQAADGKRVFGADITLKQASQELSLQKITPDTQLALVQASGHLIAHSDESLLYREGNGDAQGVRHIEDPVLGPLAALGKRMGRSIGKDLSLQHEGRSWLALTRTLHHNDHRERQLLVLIPADELMGDAYESLKRSALIAALALLLALPLIWWAARALTRPLQQVLLQTERIRHFDFDHAFHPTTHIREIRALSHAVDGMRETIQRFLDLIRSLANENHFEDLLSTVQRETRQVSGADFAALWVLDESGHRLKSAPLMEKKTPVPEALPEIDLHADPDNPLSRALLEQRTRILSLAATEPRLPPQLFPLFALQQAERLHFLLVPLASREDEPAGILVLTFPDGELSRLDIEERARFVKALSGFAAVSIESQNLMRMQKNLLDSFIQLLAGAIDAKSPYTGGHCQRVPALTNLLAEAACQQKDGPFARFNLDRREWEAVHIAGWLHDCGKITSPEFVIDKATKLETLYDRIHEIRMRFEVLKRDAEIAHWQRLHEGGDPLASEKQRDAAWQALDEDFAFVARCNLGGEDMAEADLERLRSLGQKHWLRTLDDRLGISWEEAQRKARQTAPTLPVQEPLLADRPDHLIERPETEHIPSDNPWGFQLSPPDYKYNRGEIYNLCVRRGTLTAEERYMINDHIVQTIIMLERLPFPRHLQTVPELAGGHHEKMDGTGYPRQLAGHEMSTVARMMAIADIFEALTAADRPYKQAKTLSESLRIMARMSREGHIDQGLFGLFLESGVYRQYAETYLQPEQIDSVNLEEYLPPKRTQTSG